MHCSGKLFFAHSEYMKTKIIPVRVACGPYSAYAAIRFVRDTIIKWFDLILFKHFLVFGLMFQSNGIYQ